MEGNVPEIRLKGFTRPWIQRTIGSVAGVSFGGGTPSTTNSDYWNGDIPWLQSSDITEHDIIGVNLRKHITIMGLNNSSAKLIPANSIAIVTRVGVGKLSVVPFDFTTSQDFLSLSNLDIDVWFGAYVMYTKLQKELHSVQGTSIKGITKEELLNKVICVPQDKEEQTTIGEFFRTLDENITLHKQKLDGLRKLKKGYLQKMFPQAGETVPKVRLKGFTEPWTERKLSNSKDIRDGIHDSPKFYEHGHPLVTSKNLTETGLDMTNTSFISSDDYELINKRSKVDVGDIIFGMIGTIGNPVIVDRDDFAIKNVALIKNGGGIPNIFLIQHLKTHIFENYIHVENVGNTQKFLSLGKIRDYTLLTPSCEEMTLIGNFLHNIDSQITAQSQKVKQLKELKAAYLQKMFV